jgi:hypothetical protein
MENCINYRQFSAAQEVMGNIVEYTERKDKMIQFQVATPFG